MQSLSSPWLQDPMASYQIPLAKKWKRKKFRKKSQKWSLALSDAHHDMQAANEHHISNYLRKSILFYLDLNHNFHRSHASCCKIWQPLRILSICQWMRFRRKHRSVPQSWHKKWNQKTCHIPVKKTESCISRTKDAVSNLSLRVAR